MTRELAIKIIRGDTLGTSEQTDEAVAMAIEALKAQSITLDNISNAYENGYRQGKFEALQWIPCSERLPEYNEAVLTWDGVCFSVEKLIPYIRDEEGERIYGDWWVSDDYDEFESDYYPNLRDGAAVAWLPLPSPYKGDKS